MAILRWIRKIDMADLLAILSIVLLALSVYSAGGVWALITFFGVISAIASALIAWRRGGESEER